jgi:hypothetical protein
MDTKTKWIIGILLTASLVLAVVYVVFWRSSQELEGYYTVTDEFVDSSGLEIASVAFVKVEAYDSMKVLRVAEILTRNAVEGGKIDVLKARTFLYHFYITGDTAALTEAMVDELAYTHPMIVDPGSMLFMIPGGWVVRASFAEKMMQPRTVEARPSQFYMPRPGIRAIDLR